MADSSSDSSFHCDILSLRHISNSIFQFSGSKGLCAKGLSDSESAWSPTSPLDFRFFSNLSNPFSVKSSKPSSQSGQKKHFEGFKIGLGIINTLDEETKVESEILEISRRKNIVFGPQVKAGIHKTSKNFYESFPSCVRSNSLPKNYVLSEMKNSKFEPVSFNHVSRNSELPQESEAFKNVMMSLPVAATKPSSSSTDSNQILNSRTDEFCLENSYSGMSLAPVTGPSSQVHCLLNIKPNSLPISIDFSNGYLGSLSAREIELSEDYTCIISHGPNPKRTHIFGDCILECHKTDSTQFSQKEEPEMRFYKASTLSAESADPYPPANVLRFCYSCKKKLEGKDVYIYRGEKAFCSFDCRSEGILAEERSENNSVESSPDSSYHDDVFLMNLPMAN